MAAEYGNIEIVKYLINRGISINDADLAGLTALYIACHNGDKVMAQFLLENGADPRVKGPKNSTVLHTIAERGFPEICKLIIEKDK